MAQGKIYVKDGVGRRAATPAEQVRLEYNGYVPADEAEGAGDGTKPLSPPVKTPK